MARSSTFERKVILRRRALDRARAGYSANWVLEAGDGTWCAVDDDCGGGDLQLCIAGTDGELRALCGRSACDEDGGGGQVDGNRRRDGNGLGRPSSGGGWRRGNAKRWWGAKWSLHRG